MCATILDQAPRSETNPLIVIADMTASINDFASSADFVETVSQASMSGKDFLLIGVDGHDARQVMRGRLSDDSDPKSATRANQAKAMPQCLQERISSAAMPNQAGTDLQSAFELSASLVQLASEDTILVSSDGLSNSGAWRLDESSTAADARKLAEDWVAQYPIDLGGARLAWDSLGDSSQVPTSRITWMQDLAQGLCDAMLATGCEDIATPSRASHRNSALPVAPDDNPITWASITAVSEPDLCTVNLPSAVLFEADSYSLTDSAKNTLEPWVQVINGGGSTTVTGHVANVPGSAPDDLEAFSLARAEAVTNALVAMGADPGKLNSVGVGATQPMVDDRLPNGELDESVAGANRRVTLKIKGSNVCPA